MGVVRLAVTTVRGIGGIEGLCTFNSRPSISTGVASSATCDVGADGSITHECTAEGSTISFGHAVEAVGSTDAASAWGNGLARHVHRARAASAFGEVANTDDDRIAHISSDSQFRRKSVDAATAVVIAGDHGTTACAVNGYAAVKVDCVTHGDGDRTVTGSVVREPEVIVDTLNAEVITQGEVFVASAGRCGVVDGGIAVGNNQSAGAIVVGWSGHAVGISTGNARVEDTSTVAFNDVGAGTVAGTACTGNTVSTGAAVAEPCVAAVGFFHTVSAAVNAAAGTSWQAVAAKDADFSQEVIHVDQAVAVGHWPDIASRTERAVADVAKRPDDDQDVIDVKDAVAIDILGAVAERLVTRIDRATGNDAVSRSACA